MARTVVIDTNLLLDDANIIFKLSASYDKILIPLMVLNELDKHKFKPNVSYSAREAIRAILKFKEEHPDKLVHDISQEKELSETLIPDFTIINAAEQYGADLATKDISMSIIAEARGISTTLFDVVVNGIFNPYVYVTIDDIYENDETFPFASWFCSEEYLNYVDMFSKAAGKQLNKNAWFFIFINNHEEDIAIYANNPLKYELHRIDNLPRYRYFQDELFELKALDLYQICAVYAMKQAPNTLITGKWGSGKTLLATAHAITHNTRKTFISRPPVGINEKYDIGYVPGDKDEKMISWFAGFLSSLYFLFSNTRDQEDEKNKLKYDHVKDTLFKELFETIPINAIQGMSLLEGDTLVVDEIQLIDVDYLSMILSRAGKNSNVILIGDLAQTYNVVKPSESGLLKLLRALPHPSLAHVDLKESYRSDLLGLAEKLQDKTLT